MPPLAACSSDLLSLTNVVIRNRTFHTPSVLTASGDAVMLDLGERFILEANKCDESVVPQRLGGYARTETRCRYHSTLLPTCYQWHRYDRERSQVQLAASISSDQGHPKVRAASATPALLLLPSCPALPCPRKPERPGSVDGSKKGSYNPPS